jgi:exosortase
MPNSEIEIAAPCSGLRSLISLLTLGLIFAFALKISLFKKIVLFLSSIPIAIVANIIRVLLLAVVNDIYGEKIAMGFFHDCTGFVMFAVAFIGLYFVGVWLEGTAGEKA